MIFSIVDILDGWIRPFKDFIMKNHDNPVMWIILVLIGVAMWSVVFGVLHRNGD